jgi:hypothetical protein
MARMYGLLLIMTLLACPASSEHLPMEKQQLSDPKAKGGHERAVPCPVCRMPVVVHVQADGTREFFNPDGSRHSHK